LPVSRRTPQTFTKTEVAGRMRLLYPNEQTSLREGGSFYTQLIESVGEGWICIHRFIEFNLLAPYS
jgi:hypothetical protein